MDKLYVIKVGGNILDDEKALETFLKNFASIESKKILVHGGGKLANRLAEQLDLPQQMVDGRRITDAETLKIVVMVYAGLINKSIVALLQSLHTNAIGLSGADANCIVAHKRIVSGTDYGFAGDVDQVTTGFIRSVLENKITPVMAPITHDGKGQLLNTNADTMARELALALTETYDVELVYLFEKAGVLTNVDDEGSVISKLDLELFEKMKKKQLVHSGMLPKLENAFAALDKGVQKIYIGAAGNLPDILQGNAGTCITS